MQMVIEHLEVKYNKKIVISSDWHGTGSGSPVSGMVSNAPSYCEVYAEDDPNYVFPAYKYQKLNKDGKNKILDGYCWNFIREEMRKNFENRVKEIIPEDYKIIIEINSDATFNNNINKNLPL